ncbi:hypothetical protein JET14_11970 [Martelella lutilitoris]|uniref:Peptidase n=1 Tax=Martelella lutilitoris TaxID=2583532 RepID=A0A7T7HH30_9HYPH|nr:hypothetical protein [Martelella lutilitoris]QQM29056.1 hypothetical protein JET14_11970 [Martelella lutilitoris]
MSKKSSKARIEVFRSGTFTPMNGEPITYSAADLSAIADSYDRDTAPAPIVVGHPTMDAPAYGWVESFDYDATADRLFANLSDIDPDFSDAVKAGRYKKVSLAFFRPDAAANPLKGTWYPRHVGFLGGTPPAVSGLKNVQFGDKDDAVVFSAEFGERGFEETANILRSLRDFIIEKFGLEEADKAIPGWRLEWLDEIEIEKPGRPAFSAPTPERKPAVTHEKDPAFADREAKLAAREAAVSTSEKKIAHDGHVAFAEKLVTDRKLPPAQKDKLVAILDGLPDDASVAFAEGEEKVSPRKALTDLMEGLPKVVDYGEFDLGDGPENGSGRAAFASDGKAVDPERLATHEKAMAYQKQHPGTAYLDAVRAVS